MVQDRGLEPHVAGLLTTLAAAGVPILVVSSRARTGKSTLLRALLDYAPQNAEIVFLRGRHEPFTFLGTSPECHGFTSRLLVANELSRHLPVYIWGDAARRAIDLSTLPGYSLWATAHTEDANHPLIGWRESGHGEGGSRPRWNPVVVKLTSTTGKSGHGWSHVAVQLEEPAFSNAQRRTVDTTEIQWTDPGAWHALWRQATKALRRAYGSPGAFVEAVEVRTRQFSGDEYA
ncbi:MAG: hypothetical protein M3121_03030 [Chloroflexota bacterium]|nr:hypothetical protein [Chloroflexota bacterium]